MCRWCSIFSWIRAWRSFYISPETSPSRSDLDLLMIFQHPLPSCRMLKVGRPLWRLIGALNHISSDLAPPGSAIFFRRC